MLSYTDLKKGVIFIRDGKPWEVVDSSFSRMQQRKAVVQAKIRDLASGKIVEKTFQPSDYFEEADIEKRSLTFLYQHRGDFVFSEPGKPRNTTSAVPTLSGHNEVAEVDIRSKPQQRFTLQADTVGDAARWLKPNTEITAVFFGDKLLTLSVPIKMDIKVTEAPPGIQGDRSQGGAKAVTLETGAIVQVPLFINTGDMIRVNTETGEYVERVQKG